MDRCALRWLPRDWELGQDNKGFPVLLFLTLNILMSWDDEYWDLRSSSPIGSVNLPDRCYSLDVAFPLMVVGMAERHIAIFNLHNPQTIHKVCLFLPSSDFDITSLRQATTSPLKWQTRCIACFPAANGYAVGSIEGRVGIQYIDEKDNASV